jgi:competence protein ComEA
MPPGISTTPAQQSDQRPSDATDGAAPPPAAKPAPLPSDAFGTALGLNSGDRRVVSVLIVVALLLMLVHWYRLTQYRPAPIEVLHPEGYVFQLDVNSATWVEWMQLDDVGETMARRIVEDRRVYGPFASVDDVQRVPGIGPKTMETLRPHLVCTSPTVESAGAEKVGGL